MKTFQIQANEKGSRNITISEEQLQTIEKYSLLSDLLNSSGFVDQKTLDKLQLNVRALLENTHPAPELLDLCQNVLFHDNMKTFGLYNLINLYINWKQQHTEQKDEPVPEA